MEYNHNRYSQGCYQHQRTTCANNVNLNNTTAMSNNVTAACCTNDMPIGMAYVPWQMWGNIYDPAKALVRGTLFPDLDKPFLGGCR